MNSVTLIGRLTKDPELTYTPNTQTACARFTLAVDRPKRNGEDQGADFLRIVVWGKQAETCDRYLSKGRQVAVHGRIHADSYKNRDGQTVYTTDIVADNVEFLGSARGENSRSDGRNEQSGSNYQDGSQMGFDGFTAVDDDVPY
jgi:single-strand DNA-binding protein